MELSIIFLPLIASIISGFFGRYIGDRNSEIVTSALVSISAGAIVSAYGESAIEKVEILKECGVTISKNPSVMGDTVKSVLEKI